MGLVITDEVTIKEYYGLHVMDKNDIVNSAVSLKDGKLFIGEFEVASYSIFPVLDDNSLIPRLFTIRSYHSATSNDDKKSRVCRHEFGLDLMTDGYIWVGSNDAYFKDWDSAVRYINERVDGREWYINMEEPLQIPDCDAKKATVKLKS